MFTEIDKLVKKKGYVAQTESADYTVEVELVDSHPKTGPGI